MIDNTLTVALVFAQGLLSFLSPCILPLLPAWLAMLGGGLEAAQPGPKARWTLLLRTLLFTVGISLVFVALGATATALGGLLVKSGKILRYISGGLVILMGVVTMELFPVPFLQRERRVDVGRAAPGLWRSLLLGVAFGFGWTPCVGPVLSSVLMMAAATRLVWQGCLLLLVYSLGMSLPFWLLAAFFGALRRPLRWLGKHSLAVKRVAGGLLVVLGILMLTNTLQWFATL